MTHITCLVADLEQKNYVSPKKCTCKSYVTDLNKGTGASEWDIMSGKMNYDQANQTMTQTSGTDRVKATGSVGAWPPLRFKNRLCQTIS